MRKIVLAAICIILGTLSSASAQSIFYSTSSVNPDETALICGEGLSSPASVSLSRLADNSDGMPAFIEKALPDRPNHQGDIGAVLPSFDSSQSVSIPTIQANDKSLKFTVPSDCELGVYSVKVDDETIYINNPYVTWVGGDVGDYASLGGKLRVYGENIAIGDREPLVKLVGNNTVYELALEKIYDKYSAEFYVGNTPAGAYKLYLHNGYGDGTAWSMPIEVIIKNKPIKNEQIFNIRDYGARGNGKNDDSRALEHALAAARNNGGGVVYIPRGRYILTRCFNIPENTTICGEGKEKCSLTWLAYAWDIGELPESFLRGTKNFSVENITLNGSRAAAFIMSDTAIEGARDISVRNVDIFANPFFGNITAEKTKLIIDELTSEAKFAIRLGGVNVLVEDCEIYAPSGVLRISDGSKISVRNNKFYNGFAGWYNIGGCSEVCFEDNYISTCSQNGTGGGFHNIGYNKTENIYYARNTLEKIVGNDREVMTTDGGKGCYFGTVSVSGRNITALDANGYEQENLLSAKNMAALIIDGIGAGQYRIIESIASNNTVVLDSPFEVQPNSNSKVCILPINRRGIYTDINITDGGAFQFYGMGIENILDDITLNRSDSIKIWGLYTYKGYRPCWYNSVLNTRVISGNFIHRYGADDSWSANTGVSVMASGGGQMSVGTIIRNTTIDTCGEILLTASRDTTLRDSIIENTDISYSDNGIVMSADGIDSHIDSIYIRKYETNDVITPVNVTGECIYRIE